MTVQPSQLDVSSGSAIAAVTIIVNDDLSGISRGEVRFERTHGGGVIYSIPPTTGDSNYQEHVFRFSIQQYDGPNMSWLVDAWLRDKAGNRRAYSSSGLEALGISASYEVLPPTKEDDTAPELLEVNVRNPQVDASYGEATVGVSVRATDDKSGVDRVQLEFESPSGNQHAMMFAREGPISGTPADGVFARTVTVPQYSESGTWQLYRAFVTDKDDNTASYDLEELKALGLSASFEVSVNQEDITPPELVELTLDKSEVDTNAGPATIAITLRATDDLSGIFVVKVEFESPSRDKTLRPYETWKPVEGSSTDGVQVVTLTVPQSSESGIWKIDRVYLRDEVGNSKTYFVWELGYLGLTPSFKVVDEWSQ